MTRRILTIRSAATTALLGSRPVELPDRPGELHQWAEDVIASARCFSSSRIRGGGLFGARLLTKAEAQDALSKALKELEAA